MCTEDVCSPTGISPGLPRRSVLAGLGGIATIFAVSACTPAQEVASTQVLPAPGKNNMELVLLGTQAGPPVSSERTGISSALIVDGAVYIIDCGRSSVTQYVKAGLRFENLKSIFITHLHADHIADYYNFLLLTGAAPTTDGDILKRTKVYGPGPAGGLLPKFGGGNVATIAPDDPTPGIADMTKKLHASYAYSSNVFMRDGSPDVRDIAEVHDIPLPNTDANYENSHPTMEPFVVMKDENVTVTATLVIHGTVFPAFAYRFDTKYGSVTFSGDTAKSENLIALAKGSDVLVHEAINVRGAKMTEALRAHMLAAHVEIQEMGKVAQETGVPKLVLSHISDRVSEPIDVNSWHNWAKENYDGEVIVGEDLQRIPIRQAGAAS